MTEFHPESVRARIDRLLFGVLPPGATVHDLRDLGNAIFGLVRDRWTLRDDPEAIDLGGMPIDRDAPTRCAKLTKEK